MNSGIDDTSPARFETPHRTANDVSGIERSDIDADTILKRIVVADLIDPPARDASAPTVERAIAETLPASLRETRRLYRLKIVRGDEAHDLERPVRIGRNPSDARMPVGQPAVLCTVRSVRQEVSATHIEVRQVAGSVVVTDLRSTNGSTITQPGSRPRKLRQGESMVVTPGTVVDIGDGNIVEILSPARSA